jgi:hypothetical protein
MPFFFSFFFFFLKKKLQIGVDRNDLSKVFIQLTLEFLTKQVNLIWSKFPLFIMVVPSLLFIEIYILQSVCKAWVYPNLGEKHLSSGKLKAD